MENEVNIDELALEHLVNFFKSEVGNTYVYITDKKKLLKCIVKFVNVYLEKSGLETVDSKRLEMLEESFSNRPG